MADRRNDWRPSSKQWVGISAAAGTMTMVAGPVGGALTAAGATAGACAANKLGWTDSEKEDRD